MSTILGPTSTSGARVSFFQVMLQHLHTEKNDNCWSCKIANL